MATKRSPEPDDDDDETTRRVVIVGEPTSDDGPTMRDDEPTARVVRFKITGVPSSRQNIVARVFAETNTTGEREYLAASPILEEAVRGATPDEALARLKQALTEELSLQLGAQVKLVREK